MKRLIAILLAALLCVALFACGEEATENEGVPTLRFDKNGELKILVLADTQDYAEPNEKMMDFIEDMLDYTKPDVVIFTGDNVIETNVEKFRKGAEALLAPLVKRKIPYAYTFGNHDDEFGVSKEEQAGVFASIGECLTYDADPAISGVGNCVIPVKAAKGNKIKFNLWILDSNTYDGLNGGYDHVHDDQLEWVRKTAEEMNESEGRIIPSMFFQHIIPSEVVSLLVPSKLPSGSDGTKEYYGKNFSLQLAEGVEGYLGEFPCPGTEYGNQISVLKEIGGVVGVVSGHDHSNAFIGKTNEIDLIQCPGVSFASYGDDICRGCRLITIKEDGEYESKLFTIAMNDEGAYKK